MKPKHDPLVAVAYLRASKDEQRLSPEAQRASIEQWAAREGVRVAAWHAEHLTSVTPLEARPAFLAALSSLREHRAGILVVAKRDRLARDPALTAAAESAAAKSGATVQSAAGEGNGSTPADEFMRGIVDTASRYERALIRARTKAALGALKSAGRRAGECPFGWRPGPDGTHLERDPAEQAVLALVGELRHHSQRRIVSELEARGHVSRSGSPLGKTQVARMLAALPALDVAAE